MLHNIEIKNLCRKYYNVANEIPLLSTTRCKVVMIHILLETHRVIVEVSVKVGL